MTYIFLIHIQYVGSKKSLSELLTIIKVDKLGNLLPCPVVKVSHLVLILHNGTIYTTFFAATSYQILDSIKIFAMLQKQ